MEESVFKKLNAINVNDKVEKKSDKLTYLSWPFAWGEVKKLYPDSSYVVERFDGKPYLYDENLGYMVFTSMTIDRQTHDMWLPVMDGANKAMKAISYDYPGVGWKDGKKIEVPKTCEAATMFDINKTIMRCLVKNMAMFGLALYIYAGEDLPEGDTTAKAAEAKKEAPAKVENGLIPLVVDDKNWAKVAKYITDNKQHGFTTLTEQLRRKYILETDVLIAIQNLIDG